MKVQCDYLRCMDFFYYPLLCSVISTTSSSSPLFATSGMFSPSSCQLLRVPGVYVSLPNGASLTSGDKSVIHFGLGQYFV